MAQPNTSLKKTSNNNIQPKKGIRSSVSQALQKWRVAFKKLTHDTLNSLDDSTMTDDKIEALFQCDTMSTNSQPCRMERRSSASVSIPPMLNIAVEMRLTDETDSLDASYSDSDGVDEEKETFATYDTAARCQQLRHELGEPFWQSDMIWKERRGFWVQVNPKNNDIECSEKRRVSFLKLPSDYYSRVYKKLVVDDKPLREPLNLEDAMKIINSGWAETKKWSNVVKGLP